MRGRAWALGLAGAFVLAIVGAGFWFAGPTQQRQQARGPKTAADVDTTELAARLAAGDADALSAFRDKVIAIGEQGQAAKITQDELTDQIELLHGSARGLTKYGPTGRAMIAGLAGTILERLAVEPAPPNWTRCLTPIHEVLGQTLADPESTVRVAALSVTARTWNWLPGRGPLPVEETFLGEWKDSFTKAVTGLLVDPDAQVRAAAVLNLAQVPIDEMAAPAAVRVADVAVEVRRQTLIGFAKRPEVLPEESILPRLHDEDQSVVMLARVILEQRGLSAAQIELGEQVFSPLVSVRKNVVHHLEGRDDIDPIVWLIHLSRDPDQSVRSEVLDALSKAQLALPNVRERLTEMALNDPSGKVRVRARALLPTEAAALLPDADATDATVAIPPLPGSSALRPRAN